MRYFIIFLLSVIVTGCAVKETEYVTKIEYQYVTYEIPQKLKGNCKPNKPMDVETYTKLTGEERENYLSNYIISLMGDLKNCDNRVKSIIRYIDEVNLLNNPPTTKK